jgi:uncharacterized protein YdeI (YjbR/CyaY-like superfamily)
LSLEDPHPEEVVEFESADQWERWLSKNHAKSRGVWMRMYKKSSGVLSIKNADALDAALCYGWITGQSKPLDDRSWLNRYVPRRPKSIWSRINVERVEKLIGEGRVKPSGLRQVEDAKRDGRWERAYSPPSKATVPEDFLVELRKHPKSESFFKTLYRTNVYSVVFRLQTTKSAALRQEKIKRMVEMFETGKKFH